MERIECLLCKMSGGFATCDMSNCKQCNADVASGCYSFCDSCSVKLNRCYHCGEAIKDKKEYLSQVDKQIAKLQEDLICFKDATFASSLQSEIETWQQLKRTLEN